MCFPEPTGFAQPYVKAKLDNATCADSVQEILANCDVANRAPCLRHGNRCNVPSADIKLFGAPCVDDSSMGGLRKDDGISRRVSLNNMHCIFPFCVVSCL